MSRFDVVSADGTRLEGWSNGAEGLPLLLCNGLGTTPASWPALLDDDCGFAALSWHQRGTFGSDRPADASRIRIEDHVDDAVAVLDAAGLERALVASWSIGVNVAFELAARHPSRVAGVLAVAGVPGATFTTMGAPWGIPRPLRRPVALGVTQAARAAGPLLSAVSARLPADRRTAWLLSHSVMSRAARPEVVVPMLEEFLRHDWRWYMTLALAAGDHGAMDLSTIACPVTLVGGRSDVLTSMRDVVAVGERLADSRVVVLPGTHFLPLEHPALLLSELRELARRTELAR